MWVVQCGQVTLSQCKISLTYVPRGNLMLVLTSPSGSRSTLLFPRPRDTLGSRCHYSLGPLGPLGLLEPLLPRVARTTRVTRATKA